MNSLHIFVTLCLGLAAANVMKRQASPPPPTLPPMKSDAATNGVPMTTAPADPATQPPMPSTTMVVIQSSPESSAPQDTPTAMMNTTPMATMGSPTMMDSTTMPPTTTTQQTNPPTPGTTKKPTIDELVTVDEILEVFGNIAQSDFFKKLPYDDQIMVMEILAGGETGKMSPILDNIELKHLLSFMYNLPFRYADPLWRVIFLGYTREEIIAQ